MPSVNPPVDAGQALTLPEYLLEDAPVVVVRVGEVRECDTLPQPCAFRYVILDAGGRRFAGYAWET